MKPLDKQSQQLVVDHLNIADKVAAKYASKQPHVQYEDLYSIALEALCITASLNPDPSTFRSRANVAAKCDILNYLEKANLRRKTELLVSTYQTDEDEEYTIESFPDNTRMTPDIEAELRMDLNKLSGRDRYIAGALLEGSTQTATGRELGISRQAVKRRVAAIKKDNKES